MPHHFVSFGCCPPFPLLTFLSFCVAFSLFLFLAFANNNHDIALVNTFFSTPRAAYHMLSTGEVKRSPLHLARQRDRKFVRNVTMHPQPSFFPISDHNIMSAPVKLIGHFARNRRLRTSTKSPLNRRRLMTDSKLRQDVATAVGRRIEGETQASVNAWRRKHL